MRRDVCFGAVVAALLLAATEPPAAQQVIKATGQPATRGGEDSGSREAVVRKRYSLGVKGGGPSSRPVAAMRWEPIIGMDAQLFPSFIVSTATMRLPQEDDGEGDPRQLGGG